MAVNLHKELARIHHERGGRARQKMSQLVLDIDNPTGPEVTGEGQRAKLHEGKATFFVRVADFMSKLVTEQKLPEPTIDDYLEVLRLREQKVAPPPAEERGPEKAGRVRRAQEVRPSYVLLTEASKKTGLGASTIKNYAEKGLLQEGVHFVRRRVGKGRSTLDLTNEGLDLLRDIKRHTGKKEKPRVATLIERVKSHFAVRERRLADYRQVRMTTVKAAKLADLLSSMPLDLGQQFRVELDQATKTFCSAIWGNFCNRADRQKYNAEFFRRRVIPQLKRDLLAFCKDPAGAYRFFQDRPEFSKFEGDDETRASFSRVVTTTQLLLEKIDPKERVRFVEELVSMKGPLLRQEHPGSPVERAR